MTYTNKKEDYLPRKYPHLATLIGAYLYQDLDIEYGSPENALKDFCTGEPMRNRQQTIKEIQAFLTAHFAKNKMGEAVMEDEIYEDLLRMGLGYFYLNGGYTGVSWLKHLEAEIQKSLRDE